jgi:hypothetical protein
MAIVYRGVKGSKLTIAEIDGNFSDLNSRVNALPDSSQVSSIILADVDSAYVQARQVDVYRDSGFVTGIVNSSYIQGLQTTFDFLDSAEAIALIDSTYVQARQADIYRDSGFVTGIVNSSYIQGLQTTFDFLDSAEAIALIDSTYVQVRQTPQDFAYASLTGAPTNVSQFANDAGYLTAATTVDSAEVSSIILNDVDSAYVQARQADIFRDSGFVTGIIDSAYIQARQIDIYRDSGFVTGIVDSAYINTRVGLDFSAINQDMIPAADSTYDLGDSNFKWKDLHLSGNTIYLGDIKIKSILGGTGIEVLDNNDSAITLGGGLSAAQVENRIDTILPYGQLGEFVVSSVNNSNTYTTDFLVSVSDKIVDDAGALSRELLDAPSLADIFNTWDRFSHDASLTFPANASEAAAWSYNAGTNTVSSTVNSGTVTGFYSPDTYDNWTFTTDLASAGADNDIGFVVAGFVTDPVTGYEYTLTVFRQTDGGIGGLGSWGIVYNMGQTDQQILATNSTANGAGGWNAAGSTQIKVVKNGRNITATTSQFGSLTLDPATVLTYDLGSNPNTVRFAGPVQYGFGAWSQDQCAFTNINFVPEVPELLYDFSSGNIYTYSAANQLWSIDSDRSLNDAPGRILHNFKTGRTFYNTGSGGYAIGTAIANGVEWDPASKSGAVPYPVFWDGASWNALY